MLTACARISFRRAPSVEGWWLLLHVTRVHETAAHARVCVCCLCYVEVQVISTMSKAETELVLVKAETTLIAGTSKNNKTRWP